MKFSDFDSVGFKAISTEDGKEFMANGFVKNTNMRSVCDVMIQGVRYGKLKKPFRFRMLRDVFVGRMNPVRIVLTEKAVW